MRYQPLDPQDRAYLREVMQSVAAKHWMSALIAMRPPIAGVTGELRAMSASEAIGYERAVANMGLLLEEPPQVPEIKSVPISED